jgi:hypothetical protein
MPGGYMAAFNGDDNNERIFMINQTASDVVLLNNGIFSGVDYAGGEYTIQVTGSTSGTCTFTTCTLYRGTDIQLGHATATDCIFDDVDRITIDANTAITGSIIRNCAGE